MDDATREVLVATLATLAEYVPEFEHAIGARLRMTMRNTVNDARTFDEVTMFLSRLESEMPVDA